MTDEDVTTEERLLLSTVYDLWSAANGVWPLYAQVDKQLDGQAIDAEAALRAVFPRLVRLDSGSLPPQASQQLSLTVRALAELPGPPPITETFTAAVGYLASREQAHDPQPPDDLEPKATSADFGQYLETSASIPRPPQVAAQLAQSVGELLRSEGHLHTYFGTDENGWVGGQGVAPGATLSRNHDVERLPGAGRRDVCGRGWVESCMAGPASECGGGERGQGDGGFRG